VLGEAWGVGLVKGGEGGKERVVCGGNGGRKGEGKGRE